MQNKLSRRDFLRGTAAGAAMLLVQSVPVVSLASESEGGDMTTTELTAFESAFLEPSMEAKPIMRWWIAPGRMTEEEVYDASCDGSLERSSEKCDQCL